MNQAVKNIRIGADVGGTFTDVILIDDEGRLHTQKVPSTPPEFEQAVLQASRQLIDDAGTSGERVSDVSHGTTVATNAVLEKRGAKTALITTKGFRDVLELRRIRAPQMYDLFFRKPEELVERYLRFEIDERMAANGEVLRPVNEADLKELKAALEKETVESVAVCLLHSYAFPNHEEQIAEFLRVQMPNVPVSISSEVLRERKEYERTATTVVNAYIRPVMKQYLQRMREGLQEMSVQAPLLIMQSAGGLTPEEEAAVRPVFVLESGPAAGVLAAGVTAQELGLDNVITLDMGGTTAKASLIEDSKIAYSPEYEVGASISAGNRLVGGGGELIRAPSIDIAEVGAGGGSIAWLDRAGGLRVGPRSAGAVPGPACYLRGGDAPTLTDANVVLGFIRPGELANGDVSIDTDAAQKAVYNQIASPLGMSLLEAAEGIHRIANARTMRALRAVSTERGRDPRDFALIAFGGSGPVHAAGLAEELSISSTIIPPHPGLFSALGLLLSGVEHHDARSCMLSGDALNAGSLQNVREELTSSLLKQFEAEGFAEDEVALNCSVDIRFKGQASEIRIGIEDESFSNETVKVMIDVFEDEHERLYGHRSDPDNPVEVIAVRLVGSVAGTGGEMKAVASDELPSGSRQVYFGKEHGSIETPVVGRKELASPTNGPLLIDEYDSTIVVPPGMQARLDEKGNVVMRET